jgi:hypothetical protein
MDSLPRLCPLVTVKGLCFNTRCWLQINSQKCKSFLWKTIRLTSSIEDSFSSKLCLSRDLWKNLALSGGCPAFCLGEQKSLKVQLWGLRHKSKEKKLNFLPKYDLVVHEKESLKCLFTLFGSLICFSSVISIGSSPAPLLLTELGKTFTNLRNVEVKIKSQVIEIHLPSLDSIWSWFGND